MLKIDGVLELCKTLATAIRQRVKGVAVPAKKPTKSCEESLWETTTKLRGSVEFSEYKRAKMNFAVRGYPHGG